MEWRSADHQRNNGAQSAVGRLQFLDPTGLRCQLFLEQLGARMRGGRIEGDASLLTECTFRSFIEPHRRPRWNTEMHFGSTSAVLVAAGRLRCAFVLLELIAALPAARRANSRLAHHGNRS